MLAQTLKMQFHSNVIKTETAQVRIGLIPRRRYQTQLISKSSKHLVKIIPDYGFCLSSMQNSFSSYPTQSSANPVSQKCWAPSS